MLIQGDISSEKTHKLVESYVKLLNSGVDSSSVLVLVQNSNKKAQFIEETLEKLSVDVVEKLQVYSFFGLVYNTICDNWADIENMIPDFSNTKILPNLTGLEVSQFIMRDIISEIKFEGYNSKKSLLHQLFRRYSLIVQNDLSDEDVKWRSEEVLKESFAPDAKAALDEFKKKTLEARALDYLRQSLIFNYIYRHSDYFKKIEYLIIDDGDEITPICFDFIEFLKPQLKDFFIAFDELGASRSGYLSADKTASAKFLKLFGGEVVDLSSKTKLAQDAKIVFQNVIEQKNIKLNNFSLLSLSKRAQMLDSGITEIKKLIENGIKPSDISVVTPVIDDMLKFYLKENLSSTWAVPLFLSGSEKIVQNPIVRASLAILKLCDEDKSDLGEFELRSVFEFLQIPIKNCREILENFETTKTFLNYSFKVDEYTQNYKKFLELLKILPQIDKLSERVYEIYAALVEPQNYTTEEITKFNFFIKQLEDFESVFGSNINKFEVISQIENSITSENPYSVLEVKDNDLVIATPQKIIDNQIKCKYQFWFDVSSDEWIKNDTGPLYNAWVFQAGWEKSEYTLQDNVELSRQKTARILRKLTLCADEKINAYASLFDTSGVENFGGIEKYLSHGVGNVSINSARPIVPRNDQKPVLAYEKGKMAISAVPGAGKTTILLALILKLLNDGVQPENIFVLTYMESAARNFRERIQNTNQELSQLPNISTIHGLALKILKENDNYQKLGLNADFEICDDTQRSRILRELAAKFDIKKTESEDFDRAVSVLKIGGGVNDYCTLTPNPSPLKGEGSTLFADISKTKLSGEGSRDFTISPCHYSEKTLNQAKELRKNQTEPEEILWFLLRNGNFCSLKFKRQAPFGKYIVDFLCNEKKLIVELDGSGHLSLKGIEHDEQRDNYIKNEGYKVLRFYNLDIFNNIESVLEKIYQEVTEPSPLRGEGRVRVSKTPNLDKKLSKFLQFFEEYKKVLQANNLIDYDDMLLFSVKLLEENPDILKYYQEICHYVIEDEAQDSSSIQQRLIELLSGKHKNLIRCGDVNQAITTTFSNADVEGFRRFINESNSVSMDCSQRCTKDVWQLANSLLTYADKSTHTKNAFYKIFMRPVDGKNPDEKNALKPFVYENEFAEKNQILKEIKKLLEKNPKATVGILLRSNFQVGRWTNFINNAGLKTITRSECLEQKGIFRTIFAILNIILNPFDNENIANNYDTLAELGHCKSNLYQTIKECPKPFIEMNVDEMNNTGLEDFWWNVIYWLAFSYLPPEELAIKIGLHYYSTEIEKSNIYLISTLIKRLSNNYKKYPELIMRLGELAKKPNLSGFKFFSEEEKSDREILEGKVQIMTLHKSKGDEFEYVFLPEMLEKSLPLSFDNVTLKKNARFMEDVRELSPTYKPKTDDEMKEFLLAENLRLMYVAITRAKRKLYISANRSTKTSSVPEPSVIFDVIKGVK